MCKKIADIMKQEFIERETKFTLKYVSFANYKNILMSHRLELYLVTLKKNSFWKLKLTLNSTTSIGSPKNPKFEQRV